MAKDYVPASDVVLEGWAANFASVLEDNCGTVGVTPAEVAPLIAESDDFAAAFADYRHQQTLMAAASAHRATKRAEMVADIRAMARRITNHPGMTNELRRKLGLARADLAPTPEPIRKLKPSILLEAGGGQVTVHWGTDPSNERTNGKPLGVIGALIYRRKVGDERYEMIGYATTSPYYDAVDGAGADYEYVVCYRGSKQSDVGPQSPAHVIAARGELAA